MAADGLRDPGDFLMDVPKKCAILDGKDGMGSTWSKVMSGFLIDAERRLRWPRVFAVLAALAAIVVAVVSIWRG
jgi:hypothetical protein